MRLGNKELSLKYHLLGIISLVILFCIIIAYGNIYKKPTVKANSPTLKSKPQQAIDKIEDAFISAVNSQKIFVGSLYYKNLTTQQEISYNSNITYTPASLLKVPLAMSYYKLSEDDPTILSKNLIYNQEVNSSTPQQDIKPSVTLTDGTTYTIAQLIEHMLKYSDNEAMRLLLTDIDDNDLQSIYKTLGIKFPSLEVTENYMTAKDYAKFFESLYSSSYLSKENSDLILNYLTNTEFTQGIVDGVPQTTKVSHKYGERAYAAGINRQLHDCGIVYTEETNYIICVMTKGSSFYTQQQVISSVSRIVYNAVKNKELY